MQFESGDYGDNVEVLSRVLYQMKNGLVEEGLQIIDELRRDIIMSGEVKSNTWLLPKLDRFLNDRQCVEAFGGRHSITNSNT